MDQLHAFSHASESKSLFLEGVLQLKADAGVMYRQLDLL
jgi:hypothetical protein